MDKGKLIIEGIRDIEFKPECKKSVKFRIPLELFDVIDISNGDGYIDLNNDGNSMIFSNFDEVFDWLVRIYPTLLEGVKVELLNNGN